jgi:hypothetical protein
LYAALDPMHRLRAPACALHSGDSNFNYRGGLGCTLLK